MLLDELQREFIKTTLKAIQDAESNVQELQQTVYGENRQNGLKGDIKNLEQRIDTLEKHQIKVDESARWKGMFMGVAFTILGSLITLGVVKLLGG